MSKVMIHQGAVDAIKEDAKRYMDKLAFDIKDIAKEECPVDTGRLQNSIETYIAPDKDTIRANAPYAYFVCMGTRYQMGNPFLQKALMIVKTS